MTDLNLSAIQNKALIISQLSARLAQTSNIAAAYELQHHIASMADDTNLLFDLYSEAELGFVDGERKFRSLAEL